MKKIGDTLILQERHYWFHERMPSWLGSAFQITLPTKFEIVEDRGGHWVVENLEPIRTEPKIFFAHEMSILLEKEEK